MTAEDRAEWLALRFHVEVLVKSSNSHPRDELRVRIHQQLIEGTLEKLNELRSHEVHVY